MLSEPSSDTSEMQSSSCFSRKFGTLWFPPSADESNASGQHDWQRRSPSNSAPSTHQLSNGKRENPFPGGNQEVCTRSRSDQRWFRASGERSAGTGVCVVRCVRVCVVVAAAVYNVC